MQDLKLLKKSVTVAL